VCVCVCVCVFIYIYIYIYILKIYTNIYIYICIYICVNIYIRFPSCSYHQALQVRGAAARHARRRKVHGVYIYIYIYLYIYIYICVCVFVCVNIYIRFPSCWCHQALQVRGSAARHARCRQVHGADRVGPRRSGGARATV